MISLIRLNFNVCIRYLRGLTVASNLVSFGAFKTFHAHSLFCPKSESGANLTPSLPYHYNVGAIHGKWPPLLFECSFGNTYLRRFIGLIWPYKISNDELQRQTGQLLVNVLMKGLRLEWQWIGHTVGKGYNCWPCHSLSQDDPLVRHPSNTSHGTVRKKCKLLRKS